MSHVGVCSKCNRKNVPVKIVYENNFVMGGPTVCERCAPPPQQQQQLPKFAFEKKEK